MDASNLINTYQDDSKPFFVRLLSPRITFCIKIGSRSSVYSPESSVRKTGSYIYEEFMPTDGTDVKVPWRFMCTVCDDFVFCFFALSAETNSIFVNVVGQVYTVGPDYAHAEARKSPALDGKVERDSEGKEIRYPVMLTAMEKLVARKVCLAFKVTHWMLPASLPARFLSFVLFCVFLSGSRTVR